VSRARDRRKAERAGRLRQFGVTVGIRAAHVEAVAEGGKANLKREFRDLGEQATEELRTYVGGAPMRSEPAVKIDGPTDDPLQGPMYALSVAALFDTNDLGANCPARLLVMQEGVDGLGAVDVARSMEGETRG